MKYICVGKMNGTHGLKGELKLRTDFVYKDKVFTHGFLFYVGDEKKQVEFLKIRKHNDVYLITFKDYENIDLASCFKNNFLYINRDDLKLEDDQLVYDDYINLDCYYNDLYLGKVIEVCNCGLNNYVLYICGDRDILIPLNDRFIDKVIKNDKILFKDVEGLLDAN